MSCSSRKHGLVCSLDCSDCKDICANIASSLDITDFESDYQSQLQNVETMKPHLIEQNALLNNLT